MDTIRWGLIGTGGISNAFASDLRLLEGHRVMAVGSRTADSARSFADKFDIAIRHASYEALANDPDVDVVYVATPHPGHHAAAMLAIEAGKAVLVEKPLTMNAEQAQSLVDAATARGTFLMEAMWTRFLPHIAAIRDVIASGDLGEIRLVTAEHGQWFAPNPEHRIFAPALGGGALLDLGVYPVSFASMVLGTPTHITAVSDPAFTGVDGQTSMLLQHDGGRQAVLTTTALAATRNGAQIAGSDAMIDIDPTFYRPTAFTVRYRDGRKTRWEQEHIGHGLRHQAAEVGRCLQAGLTQSPLLPLAESVAIMATMDEVRRQIGLTYPS